jgi:hypothetical protein
MKGEDSYDWINLDGPLPNFVLKIAEDYTNREYHAICKRVNIVAAKKELEDGDHEILDMFSAIRYKRYYVVMNHHVFVGELSGMYTDIGDTTKKDMKDYEMHYAGNVT